MLALLCSLWFATPTFAADPVSGDDAAMEAAGDDLGHDYAAIAEKLGLSADQKTKVQNLVYTHKKAAIDAKAKLAKARLDLRQALVADSLDEKAVDKALTAVGDATAELQREKVHLVVDIRKQLTADQWKALVQLRGESRRERRRERDEDDDE